MLNVGKNKWRQTNLEMNMEKKQRVLYREEEQLEKVGIDFDNYFVDGEKGLQHTSNGRKIQLPHHQYLQRRESTEAEM